MAQGRFAAKALARNWRDLAEKPGRWGFYFAVKAGRPYPSRMQNRPIVPPALPVASRSGALLSVLGESRPRGLALFLDFDGTLVDLVSQPGAVTVAPGLTESLARLNRDLQGAVAIITGRERRFVQERLGSTDLQVIGLHGAEDPAMATVADLPVLPEDVLAPLRAFAARTSGVLAEHKGSAFALHYRLAPAQAEAVQAQMRAAAARLGPAFQLRAGKMVWEICPARADKGAALARLMGRAPFAGRVPVAIGDDLTDEAMFAAAHLYDGLSIHVGALDAPSAARHRLASPAEVRALLQELAQ